MTVSLNQIIALFLCLIHFPKLLKKLFLSDYIIFLLEIGFLNPFQSGFRPGESTVRKPARLLGA